MLRTPTGLPTDLSKDGQVDAARISTESHISRHVSTKTLLLHSLGAQDSQVSRLSQCGPTTAPFLQPLTLPWSRSREK